MFMATQCYYRLSMNSFVKNTLLYMTSSVAFAFLVSSSAFAQEKNKVHQSFVQKYCSKAQEMASLFVERIKGIPVVYASRTNEDLEQEYECYAKDALKTFEIPPSRIISFKKLKPNAFARAIAIAWLNSIYVDTESMQKYPLKYPKSVKKMTFFHEMSHIKHNDGSPLHVLKVMVPGMLISALMHYYAPELVHNHAKVLYPFYLTSLALPLTVDLMNAEKRADKEACYALQCHECIREVQQKGAPYLNPAEINTIAQHIRSKNLICNDHQQVLDQLKSSLTATYPHLKAHISLSTQIPDQAVCNMIHDFTQSKIIGLQNRGKK